MEKVKVWQKMLLFCHSRATPTGGHPKGEKRESSVG